MKATDLLKKQHREVKALFRSAKKAEPGERRAIMDEIAEQLAHHMEIEEEMFYPAVREIGTKKAEELVPEAYEEHHVVKLVLNELPNVDPEDERFEAKMTVLDELIQHHVDEEESEMFKIAQKLGDQRLKDLGEQMEAAPADEPEDEDEEGRAVRAEGEEDEYDEDEDDEDADDVEFTAEMDEGEEDDEDDEELDEEDEEQAKRQKATQQPQRGRRGGGSRRSA
jgi:Hemerythrin HHE cation binding domain